MAQLKDFFASNERRRLCYVACSMGIAILLTAFISIYFLYTVSREQQEQFLHEMLRMQPENLSSAWQEAVSAKMDMRQLRAPFVKAALFSCAASLIFVGLALFLYLKVVHPIVLRAEKSAQEHRLSTLFHQAFKRSNDIMFYCDKNAVIQDVNDAFVRLYGFSRKEAVGQKPRLLRSRHSSDELYRRMWAKILDPQIGAWRGEIINRAKDGREIPLILTITAVRDDKGEILGYMSNAVDMTEHVAMQHRVAQTEALASLGEMAAVVAHEIRNPLGSIVMAAKQIATDRLVPEDRQTVLQVLRNESQRLNETLTNFLAYARPRELKLQRVDINALAQEVCNIIRSDQDLAKGIRFSLSMNPSLKPFPLDPDQIRQVIWNMVLNALQAMEGRGELFVSTGHGQGWARLDIRDTGPGIPESALETIFKPFHTTKKQGTGLGLAIADRIVKAHGGKIEVQSLKGEGASFTVLLPWTEA